jgi:hypothetical protein
MGSRVNNREIIDFGMEMGGSKVIQYRGSDWDLQYKI